VYLQLLIVCTVSAMATVATQWMMCVLLIGYILVLKPHLPGTWTGWSTHAFRGLGEFMMLAVPGEWGCPSAAKFT
jgi:Na+-driven multidrug efflux pump